MKKITDEEYEFLKDCELKVKYARPLDYIVVNIPAYGTIEFDEKKILNMQQKLKSQEKLISEMYRDKDIISKTTNRYNELLSKYSNLLLKYRKQSKKISVLNKKINNTKWYHLIFKK